MIHESTFFKIGLTPIHTLVSTIGNTCSNDFAFLKSSLELLGFMIRTCPSAALCATGQGKLPIHLLMSSSKDREPNPQAFKILVLIQRSYL